MTLMSSHSAADPPVACALSAAEAADQLTSWASLRPLCARVERAPGRAALWFAPSAEARLRAVAEREAACCPFLELAVRREQDLVRLDISSGSAGAGAVVDLLAAHASGR